MDELAAEIGSVSKIVGKYFPIYDTLVSGNIYTFYVRVDPVTLEDKFDEMRMEMKPLMFIPILTSQNGEQVIHVQKRPDIRYRSTRVNLFLLLATIGTTVFAGMTHWAGYENVSLFSWQSAAFGTVFFAFPLLAILATHEFGHYFMARKHKVAASLPFFIPSLPPLGTFGAVISMRDPIPSRKALLDIGIAGPIAGLIVAIPVTAIGLFLTSVGAKPIPTNMGEGGSLAFFPPLLFQFLEWMIPIPENVLSHPTLFAGWVGIFVTALNLIPAGQLDGGHIARALLGRSATYVSYASLIALFIFGMVYLGWMIIAILILLLGAAHPPPLNDLTKLGNRRKIIGSSAAIMLVLCFVIVPVAPIPAEYGFEFRDYNDHSLELTELNVSALANSNNSYQFVINSTGNTKAEIGLRLNVSWYVLDVLDRQVWMIYESEGRIITAQENKTYLTLNASSEINVTLAIAVPDIPPANYTIGIIGTIEYEFVSVEKELEVKIRIYDS